MQSLVSRRSFLQLAGVAATASLTACATVQMGAPVSGVSVAQETGANAPLPQVTNSDEAITRLLEGNARYVEAKMSHPDQSLARRTEVAKGQHPFAIILTCADSRVSPEILFDQGLGDLFVLRVAGNVVDDGILGSIEYGVGEFGTPLVMVLGHERCGAVKATLEHAQKGGEVPGHIGSLVKAITPVLEHAKQQQGDLLDNAVRANIAQSRDQIGGSQPLLAAAVQAAKLKVVGAYYDLDTGAVKIIA